MSSSCYGAKNGVDDCYTCDDVKNAYAAKGWGLDLNGIAQCKGSGGGGGGGGGSSDSGGGSSNSDGGNSWVNSVGGGASEEEAKPAAPPKPPRFGGPYDEFGTPLKPGLEEPMPQETPKTLSQGTRLDQFGNPVFAGSTPSPAPAPPAPAADGAAAPAAPAAPQSTSCYGARATNDCMTCDDVKNAYLAKGWALKGADVAQCKGAATAEPPKPKVPTSCYGARTTDNCNTCDEVKEAYTLKGWAFKEADFVQCQIAAASPAPVDENGEKVAPPPKPRFGGLYDEFGTPLKEGLEDKQGRPLQGAQGYKESKGYGSKYGGSKYGGGKGGKGGGSKYGGGKGGKGGAGGKGGSAGYSSYQALDVDAHDVDASPLEDASLAADAADAALAPAEHGEGGFPAAWEHPFAPGLEAGALL